VSVVCWTTSGSRKLASGVLVCQVLQYLLRFLKVTQFTQGFAFTEKSLVVVLVFSQSLVQKKEVLDLDARDGYTQKEEEPCLLFRAPVSNYLF
jgi:hypothetical protein